MRGKSEVRRRDDGMRDEPGAEDRFEQGLRRALATPPQKHKQKHDDAADAPQNRARPPARGKRG